MPRGGIRPGSGRKSVFIYHVQGQSFESLSEAAKAFGVSTKSIHNWCRGKRPDCSMEPVGDKPKENPKAASGEKSSIPQSIQDEAASANMTPLDYMLKVMRDEGEDKKVRMTMAYYAAPYIHPKPTGKAGKKDDKEERAKQAGKGRFAPGSPPALKAVK